MAETGRGRRQRQVENATTRMSKALSFLLRHGAQKEGLPMRDDGFALVSDVLGCECIIRSGCRTVEQIHNIVTSSDKQRFALTTEEGREYIRANQGHSIEVNNLDLRRVDATSVPPLVVHGTYRRFWQAIKAQGLQKMGRTHVHMAKGLPGAAGVISGMRSTCDVYIFVDVARAVADGLEFFESANGVILAAEVPPRYFSHVVGSDMQPIDQDFPNTR